MIFLESIGSRASLSANALRVLLADLVFDPTPAYGDLAAVDRARTSIAATPSARQSSPMPLHRRYDLHLECAVLIQ